MNQNMSALTVTGVSVWLDDLSRSRIESGNLRSLIDDYSVRGVTTNPTIFAAALKTEAYHDVLKREKSLGSSTEQAIFNITTEDVAAACEIFLPLYQSSGGVDGRVSIEVSPDLAFDTERTINEAIALHKKVAKENDPSHDSWSSSDYRSYCTRYISERDAHIFNRALPCSH